MANNSKPPDDWEAEDKKLREAAIAEAESTPPTPAGLPGTGGGHGYRRPRAPDYAAWLRRDSWLAAEAECLVRGIDPLETRIPDRSEIWRFMESSVAAGTFPGFGNGEGCLRVRPIDFLRWARQKGFELPEPLAKRIAEQPTRASLAAEPESAATKADGQETDKPVALHATDWPVRFDRDTGVLTVAGKDYDPFRVGTRAFRIVDHLVNCGPEGAESGDIVSLVDAPTQWRMRDAFRSKGGRARGYHKAFHRVICAVGHKRWAIVPPQS